MARPKLSASEVRNIDICVAVNQKEFDKISAKAKATKKKIAPFLRLTGLGDQSLKTVPEVNREVAKQLREMQNLLSQFAVLIEQNQIEILDPIFFIEMQKELKQMHHDFLNYGDDKNHKR